jgi:hypothetical protein
VPRLDLHSHTYYSPDSRLTFEQIRRACERAAIGVLATTDHDTADGAIALKKWARENAPELRIIVGEEILTDVGEVIGLYLNETIPAKLDVHETIDRIHAQGGLFLLEHPFDPIRHGLDEVSWDVEPDIVEIFNARARLHSSNLKAVAYAEKKGSPKCACSDAHHQSEFGSAYTETPEFDHEQPTELIRALRAGTWTGKKSPAWVSVYSTVAKLRRRAAR